MRKVRCVRGHFYDADMNTLCPHCGSPEEEKEKKETVVELEEVSETKSKKRIFGWNPSSKKKSEKKIEETGSQIENTEETIAKRKENFNSSQETDEDKTQSFWSREDSFKEEDDDFSEEDKEDSKSNMEKPKALRDIDSIKTMSKYAGKGGMEPVTGWLVCTKGINYGKAFEIKAGQSSIGRDSTMNICIKEEGITREKHAFLIFEPKKRQFFLRGGDGSGLTYCNEEMVTGMVPLKAYDKLQLGNAEFLFVPFCGEQFMWEEK